MEVLPSKLKNKVLRFVLSILVTSSFSKTSLAKDVLLFISNQALIKSDLSSSFGSATLYGFRNASSFEVLQDFVYDARLDMKVVQVQSNELKGLKDSLKDKIAPGDVVRAIALHGHGNKEAIWFHESEYSGKAAAVILADALVGQAVSPILSVHLWSCNVGCKIGKDWNLQEQFTEAFVERLDSLRIGVEQVDTLGHMSTATLEPSFGPMSFANWITMKTGLLRVARELIPRVSQSANAHKFFKKHKLISMMITGDKFRSPGAVPIVTIGLMTLAAGFSTVSASPFYGGILIGTGFTAMIVLPPMFEAIKDSLYKLVRKISVRGNQRSQEVGILNELLKDSLRARKQVTSKSCSEFILDL